MHSLSTLLVLPSKGAETHQDNWNLLTPEDVRSGNVSNTFYVAVIKLPFVSGERRSSFITANGVQFSENPLVDMKYLTIACHFATSPPMTSLTVHVLEVYQFEVSNPAGVTVWDVMWKITTVYVLFDTLGLTYVANLHRSKETPFDLWGVFRFYIELRWEKDRIWSTILKKFDWIVVLTPSKILESMKILSVPPVDVLQNPTCH